MAETTMVRLKVRVKTPFFLLCLAIAVLLLLSWQAMVLAYSNAIASQVYSEMHGNHSRDEWSHLADMMTSATDLNARNPDYQDVMLLLQQRSAMASVQDGFVLQRYRSLVQQRPAWPYAWLNLLAVKSTRQEFDSEYDRVWKQVSRLAPEERNVNAKLLQYGFRDWSHLKDDEREQVVLVVDKGLRLQPDLVKALARRFNLTPQLCAILDAKQRAILSCSDEIMLTGQLAVKGKQRG